MLKDLSEIFQKDPRHFFGDSLVTLMNVEVSPDLSLCRVYLSVLPITASENVFRRINDRKGEVRRLLGNKIGKRIRKIPELAFFHDKTEEDASHLDKLIGGLAIPPEPDDQE